MNHDPSSSFEDPAEPSDARLSALYRLHAAEAGMPSATSDARILAVAREAVAGEALTVGTLTQGESLARREAMVRERVARPAAQPAASGWQSWLKASWFGPGLAFATVASLSVIIFSLLPKEDMSIERAVNNAPGSPAPAAPAAPVATAMQTAPVASQVTAAAPSAESAGAPSVTGGSSAKQAADAPARAKLARSNATARAVLERSATAGGPTDIRTFPAAPAAGAASSSSMPATSSAASPPPAAMLSKAITQRAESMARAAPNPFPAQSAAARFERADQAAVTPGTAAPASAVPAANTVTALAPGAGSVLPAAPAGSKGTSAPAAADAVSPQQGKASLLSEPTESRMNANQPVAEVRDSAPTYPNEARPSIPLPYTYMTPRAAARNAASGSTTAASGSLAGRGTSPQLAAAPPVRDPVEWIKAIQKLRIEGKTEQVTKELTEFRRQYPSYALPDELKQIK